MTYGTELSPVANKAYTVIIVLMGVFLFIVLTQPVWNAKHLIQQQTSDCQKVGGIQIIEHGMFGDTYSCKPRLDRGVKL